eukprot:CAMPEP_0195531250 /NCGR_PEP_ID=MMETSP0794_2-20130614/34802_1 /TAXON_ID=515487 /ORGANISM="Stephanopyxis turris, Strain CCMP 815" /LENGTH=295 /DNA_ID=CAMNT_0040662969 /DNA_START=82 /DNA_END=966 /DNA_ORIENTATION=+
MAPSIPAVSSAEGSTISNAHDNLYGQTHPNETAELVSSSLKELEGELEKIAAEDKAAWTMALERCPDLCGDKFKLMFLRCEVFNVNLAAIRITKYWSKRVELFGDQKAFLPLTLSSNAFADDEIALKIGFMRLTHATDDSGRILLFADPSRFKPRQYERLSMARAVWYYLHAAVESDTAQQKGVVFLVYPRHAKFSNIDRKLLAMNAESIRGCLPIRIAAVQVLHPGKVFEIIFPILRFVMGKRLSERIHISSGTDEKVLNKLEGKYGIPRANVPSELGGGVVLDHEKWLEERRE